MIYGYVRVSSKDQNEERQIVALREFGVGLKQKACDLAESQWSVHQNMRGYHPNGRKEKFPPELQVSNSPLPIKHFCVGHTWGILDKKVEFGHRLHTSDYP